MDLLVIKHPATTAIREERLTAALDAWLGLLTDETYRNKTVASILAVEEVSEPEPSSVTTARRALVQLPLELDRMMAAIRSGIDPDLAASTVKSTQHDLATARGTIADWERRNPETTWLSADDVLAALEHAGSLSALLSGAERGPRAQLYWALGLVLLLDPVGDPPTIRASLQLCGGGGRI